jgi:Fic family protein
MSVQVGGHVAPAHSLVPLILEDWVSKNKTGVYSSLSEAVSAHLDFEGIHPFGDGNGRIGRLLFAWSLVRSDLDLFVFENKDKWEVYYPLFSLRRKGLI